jgi:membrane-bound lytic murein transglycosylase D
VPANRAPTRTRGLSRLPVVVALLLAGCAVAPTRPPPSTAPFPAPPPTADPATPAPSTAAVAPQPATTAPALPSTDDPWQRLRNGLRFANCDAPDATVDAARSRLLRDPAALQRQLQRVLPELEFVLAAIERRGLPTEFALLPLVESGFRPVPARGNRPAGIWQFMPATARAYGLRIDAQRDDRLGLASSTTAALRLLEHLGTAFDGDWSLATMAFNAGEFRVKRALAAVAADPRGSRVLPLGAINRNHLGRLRALACLVAAPAAAGVELPVLDGDDRLLALPLLAGTTLARAAGDFGIAPTRLRALNAAPLAPRLRAGETIVLPRRALAAHAAAQARLRGSADPSADAYTVRAGDSLWTIARRHDTTVQSLARHNRLDPARALRPGQVLQLPPR